MIMPGSPYLYVVRAEVTPDAPVEEWNRWYNEKHVPELLSVPGFRGAARWDSREDPRVFLATYEVDSPAVFDEPRYRDVTGWGVYAKHVVGWQRGLYRLADDGGQWGDQDMNRGAEGSDS